MNIIAEKMTDSAFLTLTEKRQFSRRGFKDG